VAGSWLLKSLLVWGRVPAPTPAEGLCRSTRDLGPDVVSPGLVAGRHSILIDNEEPVEGVAPGMHRAGMPVFGDIPQCQIEQPQEGVIVGERPACFRHLSQRSV